MYQSPGANGDPTVCFGPRRSTHMFSFMRQAEPQTLELTRAAEVFHTTLQVLKDRVRRRYKRETTAEGTDMRRSGGNLWKMDVLFIKLSPDVAQLHYANMF